MNEAARPQGRLSTQTWITATFILVLTTLGSKALGLVRDVLAAKLFGAGADVDAFMVASTLGAATAGIGSALAATVVPAYRRVLVARGPREAGAFAGGAVGLTVVLTGLVMGMLVAAPRLFVNLVTPSLPEPTAQLAAELVRWLAGFVLGINLIYIFSAVYNALEHFTIPSVMDFSSNVFVLAILILFAAPLGIRAMALGLDVGTLVVAAAVALPILLRGIARLNFRFNDPALREAALLAIPVFLWELSSQGTAVIENFFAASLEPGSISVLGYAKRLSVIVVSLFAVNIARAVFPALSRFVSEGRIADAKDLFLKLSRQYVVGFVPIGLAMIFFRREIVGLAFQRGAFDAAATERTAAALALYAVGVVVMAGVPIVIRTCYAFGDTATPLVANLQALLVMGGLTYLLAPRLGVAGIALSSSLALTFSVLAIGYRLRARFRGLQLRDLARTTVAAIACGVLALVPLQAITWARPEPWTGFWALAGGVTAFLALYFVLGWYLAPSEVRTLWVSLRGEFQGSRKP